MPTNYSYGGRWYRNEYVVNSWSREVTRSEMEYIQVHVNGAIKCGKVLGPLTLQFRINHVSAVDFAHGFRP